MPAASAQNEAQEACKDAQALNLTASSSAHWVQTCVTHQKGICTRVRGLPARANDTGNQPTPFTQLSHHISAHTLAPAERPVPVKQGNQNFDKQALDMLVMGYYPCQPSPLILEAPLALQPSLPPELYPPKGIRALNTFQQDEFDEGADCGPRSVPALEDMVATEGR
jgi:hypothetical protein